MSDCAGAFGAFYNADIGGAQAYFIAHDGAKASGPAPSSGISGGTIAGHPIKIVVRYFTRILGRPNHRH